MAKLQFLLAVILAACGGRPAPNAGPLYLDDDAGHRTALAAPAARIVSLMPATTELVFALGAGDRVVGRTRWCDYPAQAGSVTSVGDGMQPNVEAIVALQPDLVLAYRSGANRAAVDRLRGLGVATVELDLNLLADLERVTALLAKAVGRPQAGDSLIAALRADLDRVTVHPTKPAGVFVLTWSQPPITLGAGSFLTEIIARAGGRNIFDDQPQPSFVVSLEAVATRNPDFILVTGDGEPDWAKRAEWKVVPAVRERRFLRVAGSEFNRPSPRVGDAISRLARQLGGR